VAALTLSIAAGGARPLILSTTSEAAHIAMAEMGSQAAFTIALVRSRSRRSSSTRLG
jgi:hypothetical protein